MYSLVLVYYNIYDQIQTSISARNIIVSKNYSGLFHNHVYISFIQIQKRYPQRQLTIKHRGIHSYNGIHI